MVQNLPSSENPPQPFQAPLSKTRSAAHFLRALVLAAPMGAARPPWGEKGKREARSPAGAHRPKPAEGLRSRRCKSSGAGELC